MTVLVFRMANVQEDGVAPAAKKAKLEPPDDGVFLEQKQEPRYLVDPSFDRCCRAYVLDKYAIVSYKDESNWMQIECAVPEQCPRKLPKPSPLEIKNETLEPSELTNSGNCSSNLTTQIEDKTTIEVSVTLTSPTQKSSPNITLKSSLSTSNVCQAGNSTASVTTTKSVSFSLPPDHKEDRISLGSVSKVNKKGVHASKADVFIEESESYAEQLNDQLQNAATDSNVTNATVDVKMGPLMPNIHTLGAPPPSLPSYPPPMPKHPVNTISAPPPQLNAPPAGFPPYPDPLQFPNAVNGSNFIHHPQHSVPPQPLVPANPGQPPLYMGGPSGYQRPPSLPMHHIVPPNYPHAGAFVGGHPPRHLSPNPSIKEHSSRVTYPPAPIGRFPNGTTVERNISSGSIYPKSPEFHQHLHSHLHQHMHYPPSGTQNPNLGSSVGKNGPSSVAHVLTMAVQPKGKWCGAHAKIAFFIHAHKRDKHDLVPNTTGAFVALQPSKNSPFSKVSTGSSNQPKSTNQQSISTNGNSQNLTVEPHMQSRGT